MPLRRRAEGAMPLMRRAEGAMPLRRRAEGAIYGEGPRGPCLTAKGRGGHAFTAKGRGGHAFTAKGRGGHAFTVKGRGGLGRRVWRGPNDAVVSVDPLRCHAVGIRSPTPRRFAVSRRHAPRQLKNKSAARPRGRRPSCSAWHRAAAPAHGTYEYPAIDIAISDPIDSRWYLLIPGY